MKDTEAATLAIQLKHEMLAEGETAKEALATAEVALKRMRALDKVVRSIVELFPELEEAVGLDVDIPANPIAETTPKGAEAVRIILQEAVGYDQTVSGLVRELTERDWLPDSANPASAIRAALERLVKADDSDVYKSERNGKVTYVYDPDRIPGPGRPAANEPSDFGEEPF